MEAMTKALQTELVLQKKYLQGVPLNSIYFGGGTPSAMPIKYLEQLFRTIRNTYIIENSVEITLEANPEDITIEACQGWQELGVNRLSIGIQSFHDPFLIWMNRSHNSDQSHRAIENAINTRFTNITADLIYGIPHSDHTILQTDLESLESYTLPHISAYCLTIEEKTMFGKRAKKGTMNPIPDGFSSQQLLHVKDYLEQQGYLHYEISNFAKPSNFAIHNTAYWFGSPYIGIGPGAHSFNGLTRQWNVSNNNLYIKSISNGQLPIEFEKLSQANKHNEFVLTRLRTFWGIPIADYQLLFPEQFQNTEKYVSKQIALGTMIKTETAYCLTKKGILFADAIASDLFVTT